MRRSERCVLNSKPSFAREFRRVHPWPTPQRRRLDEMAEVIGGRSHGPARGQQRSLHPRPACNDQPVRYSCESDAAGVGISYVRAISRRFANAKIR